MSDINVFSSDTEKHIIFFVTKITHKNASRVLLIFSLSAAVF